MLRSRLSRLPLSSSQIGGQRGGSIGRVGGQQFDAQRGLAQPAGRVEPRRQREADVLARQFRLLIDVVCLDQSGIVSGLSGFFATRGIDIAEVSTRSYPAAHTGAPMFAVQMIVNVPSRIHVAHLREEFMEFCDSLNLDAILEPVKS